MMRIQSANALIDINKKSGEALLTNMVLDSEPLNLQL